MKVQKITAILREAGFEASRTVTIQDGNVRRRELRHGYSASQVNRTTVGIECCGCLDRMPEIIRALNAAGYTAREAVPGGGYLVVK
jgi:hypothetical protein